MHGGTQGERVCTSANARVMVVSPWKVVSKGSGSPRALVKRFVDPLDGAVSGCKLKLAQVQMFLYFGLILAVSSSLVEFI